MQANKTKTKEYKENCNYAKIRCAKSSKLKIRENMMRAEKSCPTVNGSSL